MSATDSGPAARRVLRQQAEPTAAATVAPGGSAGGVAARPGGRGWVVPALAATALVGVTAAVWMASQGDAHAPAATAGSRGATGSILGSWRLVAATTGHPVRVPTTPAFIVTFRGDGTAVILTGVNAITLTVSYDPEAITARFRLTTAAFDGSTDPDRLAILGLLDALAPSAAPAPAVRSSYQIDGDRLTIQVRGGTLDLSRIPGGPDGSGPASSAPAAPRSP